MVDVRIEVIVDPRQAVTGSRKVRNEIDRTEDSADRLRRTIRNALAGIGVGLVLRELGQLADAYTNVQNRIRTVTDSEQELSDVTEQLFQIANDTRSAFDATTEVYARTALAAKDLGISQQKTLDFTRSLNQAVILSGAAADEARAGLIQLSQGLASGALRGDELRSVLEQLPVVADVIAKSLGVTRGELREMGAEGKITADIILRAFDEASEDLEQRFGETVPTIGQSFTVLRNNIVQAVGEFDQASGASGSLAAVITFLAENLDIAAGGVLVLAAVIATAYIPATFTATSLTTLLIAKIAALNLAAIASTAGFAAIGAAAAIAANRVAQEFEEAQQRISDATEAGEKFALTDFGKVGADIIRVRENLARVTEEIQRDEAAGKQASEVQLTLQARFQKQLELLTGEQKRLADGTAQSATEARAQTKALEETAKAIDRSVASIAQENALLRLGSREREIQAALLEEIARIEKDKDNAKVNAEQAERIRLALVENQALRDRADALELVNGPQEKFETQVRALNGLLQEGTIDQEAFNAAVAKLAETLEGVDTSGLNLQGIDLSGLEGGGLDALLAKLRELNAEQATTFESVQAQLLEEQRLLGLTAQEREVQIELARQLQAIEEDQGAAAAAEAAPRLEALIRENQELALQASILEQINGPAAQLAQTQQALNALLATGAINAQQYAIALGNAKLGVEGLGRTAGEGAASGLQQIENRLVDIGGTVEQTLVNGFGAAEDALVSLVRTGQADFGALVDSILDDLARLLVQQALLGLLGGPGAAAGAGFFGLGGGAPKADGGPVDAGRSYTVGEHKRPELFTPESAGRVSSASQTARMMQPVVNVTTGSPIVQNIIVRDPREIPEAMNTPEGEEVVLNVIRKNPHVVQR